MTFDEECLTEVSFPKYWYRTRVNLLNSFSQTSASQVRESGAEGGPKNVMDGKGEYAALLHPREEPHPTSSREADKQRYGVPTCLA